MINEHEPLYCTNINIQEQRTVNMIINNKKRRTYCPQVGSNRQKIQPNRDRDVTGQANKKDTKKSRARERQRKNKIKDDTQIIIVI